MRRPDWIILRMIRFFPDRQDTLSGEAVFRISLELPDSEFSLNIENNDGMKVGEVLAKINVDRIKANQPKKRVTKTSRMKGRKIEVTFEILGVEFNRTERLVSSCFISYCFVGPEISVVRSDQKGKASLVHRFTHRDVISIPSCENAFLKFLSDGIRLRVWTSVSFPPNSLPRPIFFKINSRQIELTIVRTATKEKFRVTADTGALIFKMKRQLENYVNTHPGRIKLHLRDEDLDILIELDNLKTLSDYAVTSTETLFLSTHSGIISGALKENDPNIRKMLNVLGTIPPNTMDEHREENRLLRKYLREAIDRINELRQTRRGKPRRNLLTKKALLKESS